MLGPLCHTNFKGSGNPEHGVMLVNTAPGKEEEKTGEPFVGSAGKLLNAILDSCDWPREKCYVTNMICWWKNAPNDKDIAKCRDRLVSEIATVKPKLIIPLGTIPSEAFVGEKVSKARGIPKWSAKLNCYVMPTYHPAAILHDADKSWYVHDITRDFSKIPLILTWPDGGTPPVEYKVAQTNIDIDLFFIDLPPNTIISLDIENNYGQQDDIDVYNDRMLCFSMTATSEDNVESTLVVPIDWLNSVPWQRVAHKFRWQFHNGMFDTQGIYRYLGQWLPIDEDTLLMSYALDEREEGRHGLKPLAREFCGSGYYEEEIRKLKSKEFDKLHEYNAKDTAYTHRLGKIFQQRIIDEGVDYLYRRILIPAANAFARMNAHGVFVDREAVRQLGLEWFPKHIETDNLLQEIVEESGWTSGPINLNSSQQLASFIYKTLGLKATHFSEKTGAPSADKEALEELSGEHPFIDLLLKYRQLDHMVNTYIIGIVDDIKMDMRLHPNVLLHGTVTGRTSYRKPPLQTIPRDFRPGELPLNRVRKMFAASNDDYVLLEADFKQIELWVAYFYSGDKKMYENLMTGDFHGATARDPNVYGAVSCAIHDSTVHDCMNCVQWDYDRTNAKRVGFGIMYDRTEYGLSKGPSRIADTPEEARPYLQGWRALYSTYSEWTDSIKKEALENGYLRSPTGRLRRFRLVLPEQERRVMRQSPNFKIQSLAGDYTLDSLIELHPLMLALGCNPLLVVHDSILFELRRDKLDVAIATIREVMQKPRFGFPGVQVDMKFGKNWLEMQKVK